MLSLSKSSSSSKSQAPSATLSMEVSYTFHSHLIGRSGKNINRLMDETGTRIHFPDRNRISGQSKINDVVIRGEVDKLEDARQRIRASVPVEIFIDCCIDSILSIGESTLADYLSKTFGVILRFYPKIDGVGCQVNIRGQQDRMELLNQAVVYLSNLLHTPVESVAMKMESSFDHIWLVREHVDKIVSVTGAGIRCPDISKLKELPKKYSIWIRGSIYSVYFASVMLSGLLPLQLMTQIPSERIDYDVFNLAQEADVLFHVEHSTLSTKTIRLVSYEWNSKIMFDLLRRCLNLPSIQFVRPLPSNWLELKNITENSFLSATKKLFRSSNQCGFPQPSVLAISIPPPISSGYSSASSSSFSPPLAAATESLVPASLTASQFDKNSFRLLSELLDTIGLSQYSDLFLSNEVDMAMFTTLNGQDLISMGVKAFGARRTMLNSIEELRR